MDGVSLESVCPGSRGRSRGCPIYEQNLPEQTFLILDGYMSVDLEVALTVVFLVVDDMR
jgi:hypothetical protein